MDYQLILSYILRIAVALPFLYVPIAVYFHPDNWIWFVPDFVAFVVPKIIFLHAFGVIQIFIGIGILVLRNPILPTLAAIGALIGIIVTNGSAFDITFRDVSILLAAIALALLYLPTKQKNKQEPPSSLTQ